MGRRTPRSTPETPRVVAYVRVSTQEQADSHAGLDAQRAAIEASCSARGWSLVEFFEDAAVSGKTTLNRPRLAAALDALATGAANVLMVSKLDRLSRSLRDFIDVLDRATREGWRLVILDLDVDTQSPSGEVMAHVAGAFAQFERRLISARTVAALAAVRARGVRLGRPRQLPPDVVERIVAERAVGRTLEAISDGLNDHGVATAQGGLRWYRATVAAVLRSVEIDAAVKIAAAA